MASRRCACGRELLEVGSRCRCPACGASAAAWLVVNEEGERVASASTREMMPGEELRAGLRYAARATWPAG